MTEENSTPVQGIPPPALPPPLLPNGAAAGKPGPDERNWAMFCHLAALAGMVLPVPFANLLGPLVLWLMKKEAWPFVLDQGREAVNFQISITLYFFLAIPLCFVLIGFVLLPLLAVFNVVAVIIATVKASEGVAFRYPACIRFIR